MTARAGSSAQGGAPAHVLPWGTFFSFDASDSA